MLDKIFDVSERLDFYLKEVELRCGKEPIIPPVFYVRAQTVRLQEVPLYLETGALNTNRLRVTYKVLKDIATMQRLTYVDKQIKKDSAVSKYFRELSGHLYSDEQLYVLSDAVKALKSRRRPSFQAFPETLRIQDVLGDSDSNSHSK